MGEYNPHQNEELVMGILRGVYPGKSIRPATDQEQRRDIDCWVGSESVSIKSQLTAKKTGNFSFQLEVQYRDGRWYKSDFYTSQAAWYALYTGTHLYRLDAVDLWEYSGGAKEFTSYRNLTTDTKQKQDSINHPHKDALLGLFSVAELVDAEVAKLIWWEK